MLQSLDFDWFILLLRLIFIFLLYFFLYQVVRVTMRELTAIAAAEPAAPPPARSFGRLVVVDAAESDLPPGTSFVLQPVTMVGRHPDSTIAVDEPFVSAEHAEIAFDRGRWWVRDLNSTNGTFVNGNPVTVATGVRPGDVVQFGRIKLQFVP
jgi:pSer/pThr/pTyr-binding forkhead associated (FHA) protein